MSARYYEAVGRRKTSSARVRVYPGTGTIVVNDRPVEQYFGRGTDILILTRPLQVTDTLNSYNISVQVAGGGTVWAGGRGVAGHCPGAVPGRRESARRAEVERPADPRCPCQGTQALRSEACPQGASVHEALKDLPDSDCGFRIGHLAGPKSAFCVKYGIGEAVMIQSR